MTQDEFNDIAAAEAIALEKVRAAAAAMLHTAAPHWHLGDGCGGEILRIVLDEAHKLGLPVDPRGAAIAREATDSYANASLRLAGIRRDVLKLAARDGLQCHYCGCTLNERTLQVDHIVPRTKGGSNHLWNLVLSCAKCNGKKGARDYHNFKSECPT